MVIFSPGTNWQRGKTERWRGENLGGCRKFALGQNPKSVQMEFRGFGTQDDILVIFSRIGDVHLLRH